MGLRAARELKRNELLLVPCANVISQLHLKADSGIDFGMEVKMPDYKGADFKFFMSKPHQPVKPDEEWKDEIVNPFFWVKETPSQEVANMVWKKEQVEGADGTKSKFMCLTNKRAVQPMTQLYVYKEVVAAQPLAGAAVVPASSAEATPTAKAEAAPTAKKASKRQRVR